jgi:hypothetical protein
MIDLSHLSRILSLLSQIGPPAVLVPRATPTIRPARPHPTTPLSLPVSPSPFARYGIKSQARAEW